MCDTTLCSELFVHWPKERDKYCVSITYSFERTGLMPSIGRSGMSASNESVENQLWSFQG